MEKNVIDGKEYFFVLVSGHPEGTAPRDAMAGIGMEPAGFTNNYVYEVFRRPDDAPVNLLGARSTSERKAQAARENGKKGGRPKTKA